MNNIKIRLVFVYSALLLMSGILITMPSVLVAQKDPVDYAETITEQDLESHLAVLANDSLEGRGAGSPGQAKAAEYIRNEFYQDQLISVSDTGFFQQFPLFQKYTDSVVIYHQDKVYSDDVVYLGETNLDETLTTEVVFIGNGTPEEAEKIDLEGKAIAFWESDYWRWRNRMKWGKERGVVAYLTILNGDQQYLERVKNYTSRPQFYQEEPEQEPEEEEQIAFMITEKMAMEIFNTDEKGLSDFNRKKLLTTQIGLKAQKLTKKINMRNVVGMIPGTDLKNEAIIISAHYDHLGKSGELIYNGADDNGSGVATVLEIAEAFATAATEGNGPRRTVIFIALSSEEIGLFGSDYYVKQPLFPLENTVTNLNIDMVGRVDEVHQANPNYIYLIGSDKLSQDLHLLSEQVNSTFSNLELDYTYNRDDDPNRYYYRSDHYNFAKNQIPVIFYFNGTHEDYHKPDDTIDKINFEIMEKRARLIYYTAWEIANRDQRVVLDDTEEEKIQRNLEK